MSLPPDIDRNITYSPMALPTKSMFLTTFKQPLTLHEHYVLAKRMFPWSFYDEDTDTTWILYKAKDLGFGGVCENDMILTEYTEEGCVYHWEYACNWDTDQLWVREFI